MHHSPLAGMAMGAHLAMAPTGTATAAVATAPTTVTTDQRFHYGGSNRAGRAYGSRGACNGIPFGKDANQD